MSAFAGVYYYNNKINVDQKFRRQLICLINRSKKNTVVEFDAPGFFVVHIDVNAFNYPSFVLVQNSSALSVAGQLLSPCSGNKDRSAEIEYFASLESEAKMALLKNLRGTFCLGDYSTKDHRLILAVDRIGVRPLYFYDDGQRVVFATALRVFEGLAKLISLTVDLQAITELHACGYSLGTRTPFTGVHCMRGGEANYFECGVNRLNTYWRWDQLPESPATSVAKLTDMHQSFMESVKIRLDDDRCANAFLSGGLDSRCIVAALRSLGVTLHTYNMSWRHSYDEVLGAEFASQTETHHHSVPLPDNKAGWAWPSMIASILKELPAEQAEKPERDRVVWTGDGGSVGMGRVYLNEEMINSLRQNNLVNAVQQFMKYNNIAVPRGVLRTAVRDQIVETLFHTIKEEISRFECSDPGKALFLFLLENDQRRHMASFYEEIDQNRLEYQMPFFDGDFFAVATALPLDATLYHRFYNEWLKTFGETTCNVPWQAYPGHEPCPHQLPVSGESQWGRKSKISSLLQRCNQLKAGVRWAFSGDLPSSTFSRGRLLAAGVMAAGTGRNYGYLLNAPDKFVHYLRLCEQG